MEPTPQLLENYPDTEKVAYLSAIASIATVDRAATDDELEFLRALSDSADLTPTQQQAVIHAANDPSATSLQEHLNVLKTSELRFSLVSDIISFAKADGKYTPEEQAQVQEIADYLNISQPQFSAVNQFVDTAHTAHTQGQDISSPNFLGSSGLGDTFQKAGISSGGFMKGMLGMLAPAVLTRMFSSSGRSGGLGSLLGGVLGGATMSGGGMMGTRGMMGGGANCERGGIGSIFSMLSGGREYGGMGQVLGGIKGLFGGGRRGVGF